MENLQIFLKEAAAAAKLAAPIFKASFGRAKNVELKNGNPRDQVTEADKKIERLIKQRLHKKFPSHDILGEESGLSDFNKASGFKWFIDPIDGTTNYIQGLPLCCVSIGLWDAQGPLASVVYNPNFNHLFTATRGGGAFLNGKKISVAKKQNLIHAYGGFGWGRDIKKASQNFPKLIQILNKIRSLGTSTLELCYVALGIYDFHIQAHINIWDFAAAVQIISEAGGSVTDWKGRVPTPATTTLLASNKQLHSKLLAITKKLA
jgi:myo-inositol-1(or 4)-monophosphatase